MARAQGTQGSISGKEAPEELKGPKGAKCKVSFRVCSYDTSTGVIKTKTRLTLSQIIFEFVLEVTSRVAKIHWALHCRLRQALSVLWPSASTSSKLGKSPSRCYHGPWDSHLP